MKNKVILKDDVIIPFGEYAIEAGSDACLLVEGCTVLGKPSFWRSPILWIGYKIIAREHNKLRKKK